MGQTVIRHVVVSSGQYGPNSLSPTGHAAWAQTGFPDVTDTGREGSTKVQNGAVHPIEWRNSSGAYG